MKILLFALNSSYTHTNLAVRCIKKSLAAAGFFVKIEEFNLKDNPRRMLESLVRADADVYGFSAYIWNIRELLGLAADLKRLKPGACVVFGGPEVSYDTEEILDKNPQIDCIIKGEGEAAFVRVAEMVDSGKELPSVIDGGIFDGFLSQGSIYDSEELGDGRHILYYESSRGCPYRCAYCLSALSGDVRAKSAEVTLAELRSFEEITDIKIIKFVDRTFNFDRERAKKIWRGLLSGNYTKNYHFEISADLLDEESFEILSAFEKGKIQLEIGVQSTNAETLKAINRKQNAEAVISAMELLYKVGNIHIHADLIAGLPNEDFAGFARSYDKLYGKCHMLQLGFLKLLRGSELRSRAGEFGCVFSSEPPYEVLSTHCLGFEEISRLHDIDDVAKRYGDAFSRSVSLLISRIGSPFAFFDGVAAKLRDDGIRIGECSQPKAYQKLFEYYGSDEDLELAKALYLDYLTSQKTAPPRLGNFEFKRIGSSEYKREFMYFADRCGIEYFAPALEVREFDGMIYLLERHSMRAFYRENGGFTEV